MKEIKDIKKISVNKLNGDFIQGHKKIYINDNGLKAPPENHPNGRDCPQCYGWTWKHTRLCFHCNCDIPTVEREQDELKQLELINKLKKQQESDNKSKTLWDEDSNDLFIENEHCRKKKWQVYSKRFIPFVLAIIGFLISIYLIIYYVLPNMFNLRHTDWYLIYGVIFLTVLVPTVWLNLVRNRDNKLINYYKERSELITHILRIRGDL